MSLPVLWYGKTLDGCTVMLVLMGAFALCGFLAGWALGLRTPNGRRR